MAKKTSDADIVAHLNQLAAQSPQPAHRSETGGMVLNKPPSGPSVSIEQMLADEQRRSQAGDAPRASQQGAAPVASKSAHDARAIVPAPASAAFELRAVRLDQIDDSPYQPRIEYKASEIDELGHTMAAGGQAERIKLRAKGDRFELISGHRRTRAARSIGWTQIDAVVEHDRSDDDAEKETMLACVANVELSDYEFGKMCRRAIQKGFVKAVATDDGKSPAKTNDRKTTQVEAANFFGCNQAKVSRSLAMLELPAPIISFLDRNPNIMSYVTAGVVRELITDHPAHLETIVEGVKRLEAGAPQTSLKTWVEQAVAKKGPAPRSTSRIITKARGTPVFVVKAEPRALRISLKLPKMAVSDIEEKLYQFLSEYAKEHGKDE